MHSNIFDRLSFLSLFLVITLLPFFFLPFTNIPIEVSKGLLLVLGLSLAVIFWAIARFYDGKIVLPRSMCLLVGLGIVLVVFLSALFSVSSQVSFLAPCLMSVLSGLSSPVSFLCSFPLPSFGILKKPE